jgi:23S rRNA (adenine(2503)-C(2))-methyltransferase
MDMELAQTVMTEAKVPSFRLNQLRQAVFGQLANSWDEVTTFSADLRAQLAARLPWSVLTLAREVTSEDGETVKAALRTEDKLIIEAVLMKHGDGRRTVCMSSQAGCPMKCTFCATGKLGLRRNLTRAEITEQVLYFARQLKPRGEAVTNVVVMGMGEPMHNLDEVLASIRELNAPDGLNIGARRISISTCGIVPGILRLADEPMQVNLAISLHAPTQELREKLMPVAKAYPLQKLMEAINQYVNKANRQVMFEYLLIDGVNDSDENAEELARLMRHRLYHVNLIKYHSTGEYRASPRERRDRFMTILESHQVSVTFRLSFGEDIDAACGQLAGQANC